MARHGRQIRLAEVGAEGQARIAGATVTVASEGLAAEVATRYLAGAGVGCLRVGDVMAPEVAEIAASVDASVRVEAAGPARPSEAAELADLSDPAARAVAAGAREALRALRDVLGVAGPSRAPGTLHTLHRARQPS